MRYSKLSMLPLFKNLATQQPKRRISSRFSILSEACEQRLLLTAPQLHIVQEEPPTVSGYILSQSNGPGTTMGVPMHVEVDIDDNGSVDDTFETYYDSLLSMYLWLYTLPEGFAWFGDQDISFRPVETIGVDTNPGSWVTITVPQLTNDAPVLEFAWGNDLAIWGTITDDDLGSYGVYKVEVAIGEESAGYEEWGTVDYDGTFFVTNQHSSSLGTNVLWVRVREVSAFDSAVSNAVRVEYEMEGEEGGMMTMMAGDDDEDTTHDDGLSDVVVTSDSQPDLADMAAYWLYAADDREWISLF